MNLEQALSILKENNFRVGKKMLNESDLRFDSADQFMAYTASKAYLQNNVKIGCINTLLGEKELNNVGSEIGKLVIEHYCKKYETGKKDLQEAWDLGWETEDPDGMTEKVFKKMKSKKSVFEECEEVFKKGAIMHAFLNNF